MKYIAPFILIIVGVVIGIFSAIFQFFLAIFGIGFNLLARLLTQESAPELGIFLEVLGFRDIFTLIAPLIGLCISLALIYYIIKFARTPTKNDAIVTIVLGSVGTFLGMTLSGIIVLAGGIVGIVQIGKNKEKTK